MSKKISLTLALGGLILFVYGISMTFPQLTPGFYTQDDSVLNRGHIPFALGLKDIWIIKPFHLYSPVSESILFTTIKTARVLFGENQTILVKLFLLITLWFNGTLILNLLHRLSGSLFYGFSFALLYVGHPMHVNQFALNDQLHLLVGSFFVLLLATYLWHFLRIRVLAYMIMTLVLAVPVFWHLGQTGKLADLLPALEKGVRLLLLPAIANTSYAVESTSRIVTYGSLEPVLLTGIFLCALLLKFLCRFRTGFWVATSVGIAFAAQSVFTMVQASEPRRFLEWNTRGARFDPAAHFALAELAEFQENFPGMVNHLEFIVTRFPNHWRTSAAYAKSLYFAGDKQAAKSIVRGATSGYNQTRLAPPQLVDAALTVGESKFASAQIREALQQTRNTPSLHATYLYLQGLLEAQQKNYVIAMSLLKAAQPWKDQNPQYLQALANVYQKLGDRKEALQTVVLLRRVRRSLRAL